MRTMLRVAFACSLLALLALAACGGDDGGAADATPATPDGPVVKPDAPPPPPPDAMPPPPDAMPPPPDAMPSPVDAMPSPVDAAPSSDATSDVPAACMHVCDAVFACVGVPPDPGCYTECQADLADCTPEQVMQVDACGGSTCGPGGDPQAFEDCLMMISCVMG